MRASRGFTLAEVMIAVAVTAMIGSLVWTSFASGFKAKEMVEAEAEIYRELRVGMGRLVREISMAFISASYDPERFRDNQDRPTFFDGQSDEISFSMLGHQRLTRDAKESDQSIVFYRVERDPDEKGVESLRRCEKPVIDDEPDQCEGWETLLSDVEKLELRYWDNKRNEWVNEWSTRGNDHPNQLPDRVLIEVTKKNELGKPQKFVTQARINLVTPLGM
ncbi:MAG TPA: general secretion pathway protein GspJ [Myxococcales bacterium]|jgi:general secretion pathway protein J|nr:general secretion pathway protein GspJ [Myxococcales bacterium]